MSASATPQELIGHVSPETAYLVEDYPYSFRLRTQIRYWVETKTGHGQRLVSQTRDPKRAGQPWNKPKAGTYAAIVALYLDGSNGHVECAHLSPYAEEPAIAAFAASYPLTCAEDYGQRITAGMLAYWARYRAKVAARAAQAAQAGGPADGGAS